MKMNLLRATGSLSSFTTPSSSRTPKAVPGMTTRAHFSNLPNSLHRSERPNVSVVLPTNPPSTPQTATKKLMVRGFPGAAISSNILSKYSKAYCAVFAAAIQARTVKTSIAAVPKLRRDTHNQMARASTVPKNNPGRTGTSQITNRGVQRIPSCHAKLLRMAETIASAARIIARFDADALLSTISAANE
jgi:hypothetical protein